ncbi:hypothetical protein [Enterococcus italicus]|uniref:hypothetical protein n=1 Tax=Enterococcus italicus TaxID=246144 RepID=UPI0028A63955|nr:hypothetical protein [Enterococcus italicus]
MKDKPQSIRTTIDSPFFEQYTRMIIPAIERKFNVKPGIEGELFSEPAGSLEIIIRFLSTDDRAQEICEYIDSKWEFEGPLQLIA